MVQRHGYWGLIWGGLLQLNKEEAFNSLSSSLGEHACSTHHGNIGFLLPDHCLGDSLGHCRGGLVRDS